MRLYLIRHADAVDPTENLERPLSTTGRHQVALLAGFLHGNNAFRGVTSFWHSPLARARETAELLKAGLKLDLPLVETSGLLPEDAPKSIASRIAKLQEAIALVGHEPHLSALASLLVEANPEAPFFVFKKATILALEKNRGGWSARWQILPELLSAASPRPLAHG